MIWLRSVLFFIARNTNPPPRVLSNPSRGAFGNPLEISDPRSRERGGVTPIHFIRECAPQRGRDFEVPDFERGIHEM